MYVSTERKKEGHSIYYVEETIDGKRVEMDNALKEADEKLTTKMKKEKCEECKTERLKA